MARPEIPDTSVLIQQIRDPHTWPRLRRALASGRTWLSAVVVAELYAGTKSRADVRDIDRIVTTMQRVSRILVPVAADWAQAGRLVARRTRLQGELRLRDHLADVLIVVSAARVRGVVVTINLRHFEAWAELAVAAGLDVTVTPYLR